MHPEQFLIPLTIASLILPTYIFIRAFQLRLIKSDFHVLGKKKKKKSGSTILTSTVFPTEYPAEKKRFSVVQNDPVFGVSIIKAVPSQRQWRC